MFFRPFGKCEFVFFLVTYMPLYKKGDIVGIREWALFKKDCRTNVTTGKLEVSPVFLSKRLALL